MNNEIINNSCRRPSTEFIQELVRTYVNKYLIKSLGPKPWKIFTSPSKNFEQIRNWFNWHNSILIQS